VRFWSVLDQDLHRCNLLFELGSFGAPAYLLFACAKIGMVRMDLGLLGTGFKGSTVRGLGLNWGAVAADGRPFHLPIKL